jgi:hypothetical protein
MKIRGLGALIFLAVPFALAPNFASPEAFAATLQDTSMSRPEPAVSDLLMAQARSCKAVSSCEEAVILWCSGYSRADGDGDGIPCENVCRSKEQVDRIREQIGC